MICGQSKIIEVYMSKIWKNKDILRHVIIILLHNFQSNVKVWTCEIHQHQIKDKWVIYLQVTAYATMNTINNSF